MKWKHYILFVVPPLVISLLSAIGPPIIGILAFLIKFFMQNYFKAFANKIDKKL